MNVAVIGCGYWGKKLLERVLKVLPSRNVYAADSHPHTAMVMPLNYQVRAATDYRWVLDEVEACIIATPINTHAELVQACLEAGKHVLVEKPLCQTGLIAHSLVEQARQKGLTLMTDLTFLYDSRLSGCHYHGNMRMEWGGAPSRHPEDGLWWCLGPHPVSLMLHLMDGARPLQISGMISPEECLVTYQYPGSNLIQVQLDWRSNARRRAIHLLDSKATLDLSAVPQGRSEPLMEVVLEFLRRVDRHDSRIDDVGLATVEVMEWSEQQIALSR